MTGQSFFCFLMVLGFITRTNGAACTSNELVGNSNPQSDKQNLDSSTGLSVLHSGSGFQVQCTCGEIIQWGHYAKTTGDVYFQAWRDTGSTYELVGENLVTFTASNDGNGNTPISSGTIYVIQNDYLAIYQPSNAVIPYGNGNGNTNDFKRTTSVGGATTYAWGSESVAGTRNYAFNARLDPGREKTAKTTPSTFYCILTKYTMSFTSFTVPTNLPTFSNLDGSVSVSDSVTAGTSVFTVTVSDVDGDILSTEMTTSSPYFSFDDSILEVSVLTTPPANTYSLEFKVTDRCANTATATLTVTVADPCAGSATPTFSDASPTASISTSEAVGTTVSTLTVSDTDGGTLSTVMTSSSSYFSFDTSSLEVKVLASPITAATYNLNFEVTDDCSNTATATLTVTVTDPCAGSATPTFSDAAPTASISTSEAVGTTVSTLTVSDTDGGTLSTVMTSSSSYFSFDTSSLEVKVLASPITAATYNLNFEVTDDCSNTATATLTVTVTDPCAGSATPTFSDAAPTASISTSEAVGTTVSTLTVSDTDGGTLSTVMTSSSSYFSFDTSSLEVKVLASPITAATYNLNFEVTDDCSNTATATLTVTVTDPCAGSATPTFSDAAPTASISTSEAVGTTVSTLTVSDTDGGTLSTVMTSSSSYFSFDTSSLEVKVLASPITAATYNLNFEVTDDCSNTATATLTVTVTDPCAGSATPTFSDATPTASITTSAAVGTTVFTLTVSDTDGGTLSTVMTSSSSYFSFDTSSLEIMVSSTVPAGSYSLTFQTTDDCSNTAAATLSVTVLSLSAVTPTFSGSPTISTLPDTTSVGTTVVRLTVTDPDGGTMTTTMTSSSSYFELDPVTLDVKVLSNPTSGIYVLEFQVVDNDGYSGTSQLNITIENAKPFTTSLPTYGYVTETTSTENLLHTIVTSDASPSDTVTCLLGASDPSSTDFTVKVISGSSYGIYSLVGHSFNYVTTKRYVLTINCTDSKDDVIGTFYVFVLPNTPPTFTNLPDSISIATSSSSGTNVFQVTGSDTEGDSLTYSMSYSSCPFQITSGGVVSTNQLITGDPVGYDIHVDVTDATTSVGPRVLTVKISGINSDPVIKNLPFPANISILENEPVGTTVFNVAAVDVDTSQTLTYSLTVTPSSGQTVFNVDSSGLITTSLSLDYESMTDTYFNITVTVSDGQVSDSQSFYVIIQNVNETPAFSTTTYYLSANEEQVRGTSLGTPSYGVTDPESDSVFYSIDCYQFMINATTGEITFYATYDLDLSSSSSPISCIVSADDGELTGTASLTVTINDINDNYPVLDKDIYTFMSSVTARSGDAIGTLTATDADYSALYGTVSYSINQTLLSSTYFGISGTGSLFAVADLETLGAGTVHDITVTAADTGGNSDTSLVTIIIPGITSTNDVTTDSDDRYLTFIEDTRNVAWLTSFCFTTFCSICLIGYLVYKHNSIKFFLNAIKETFQKDSSKTRKANKTPNNHRNMINRRSPNSNGSEISERSKANARMDREKFRDIRHYINNQTTRL
ncbi:cadherin-23-like [Pecten maximus]|uniref:cadherin-23-like n=1 Tax=Pecten maximus TaxID=6579 RepID=UPI00145842A3|nr:cadherin-23-like [Pecten maximus]